jgi:hypothetical protein
LGIQPLDAEVIDARIRCGRVNEVAVGILHFNRCQKQNCRASDSEASLVSQCAIGFAVAGSVSFPAGSVVLGDAPHQASPSLEPRGGNEARKSAAMPWAVRIGSPSIVYRNTCRPSSEERSMTARGFGNPVVT